MANLAPSLAYFTVGTPAFTQLALTTLGDAGDFSDGFDDAFNAVAAALTALDAGSVTGDTLLAALDGPLADFLALGDDVNDLLVAGTVISDGWEAAVQTSIFNAGYGLPAVPAISILAAPGLPSVALPALVDLTAAIAGIAGAVVQEFEQGLEDQIGNIYDQLSALESVLTSITPIGGFQGD
jgi:hypothetical protein